MGKLGRSKADVALILDRLCQSLCLLRKNSLENEAKVDREIWGWVWRIRPMIPAIVEVEAGGSGVEGHSGQKGRETLSQK